MNDAYLMSLVGTVVVCALAACVNLLLAARAISTGASLALALGFALTALTWLLAAVLPPGESADVLLLLLNSLGAVGITSLWCGFWLRGGYRVSVPLAAALLALWLLPVLAIPLFKLHRGFHVPFAAASIALGAISSIWTLYQKRSSGKNPGDWALIAWLALAVPIFVVAVLLGMSTARSDPNAVWNFYLGFLPSIFAGVGLFTLLGFTLDAVRDSRELALTDALTGLLNRRAFDRELFIACARAERFQRDLTLIVLDIDNFKQLNDSFGHPAGDAVIRSVGLVLQELSRRIDVAARIGGEEYALILPDTPTAAALRLAERLRQAVAQRGDEAIAYTASFGVAAVQDTGTVAEDLLKAADDALYAAKAAGRNCVRFAAEPDREPTALIGIVS